MIKCGEAGIPVVTKMEREFVRMDKFVKRNNGNMKEGGVDGR